MEPEFLFETLLFYDNSPCYYKIYHSEDLYIGEPTPHHFYMEKSFPYFLVRSGEEDIQVEGTDDPRMIEQIVLELKSHLQIKA